jgi:hypothetical protein
MGILAHVFVSRGLWPVLMGKDAHATATQLCPFPTRPTAKTGAFAYARPYSLDPDLL